MRRQYAALLGVVLAVALLAGVAAVGAADGIYKVDADHELAEPEAIDDYHADEYVAGEISGIDASIEISERKADVDRGGVLPVDAGHSFIRVEYREDIARTLRIWVPEEYATPYTREGVASLDGEHTADYQPVRDGEYMQVVIHVDGPTDVVLPIHKHSSATYDVINSYEERLEELTGGDREWVYVDREGLEREHAVALDVEDVDDVVIQYDATPDEPEETWVNMPRGDGDGAYWYSPDSEDGEVVYVVTRGGDAPDVRYMEGGGVREEAEGHVNDALQIPDRVLDRVENPLEGLI